MAELHLVFVDAWPVDMADLGFDKLNLRPGDLVVCTLPDGLDVTEDSLRQIGDGLKQFMVEPFGVRVVILKAGTKLVSLSDEELAELGLQRIG